MFELVNCPRQFNILQPGTDGQTRFRVSHFDQFRSSCFNLRCVGFQELGKSLTGPAANYVGGVSGVFQAGLKFRSRAHGIPFRNLFPGGRVHGMERFRLPRRCLPFSPDQNWMHSHAEFLKCVPTLTSAA